eukprot:m.57030 g.57030  ORF g.57030 m.57030 type:complete len:124 (-) comp11211_c0_seq1:393-764(-)
MSSILQQQQQQQHSDNNKSIFPNAKKTIVGGKSHGMGTANGPDRTDSAVYTSEDECDEVAVNNNHYSNTVMDENENDEDDERYEQMIQDQLLERERLMDDISTSKEMMNAALDLLKLLQQQKQ